MIKVFAVVTGVVAAVSMAASVGNPYADTGEGGRVDPSPAVVSEVPNGVLVNPATLPCSNLVINPQCDPVPREFGNSYTDEERRTTTGTGSCIAAGKVTAEDGSCVAHSYYNETDTRPVPKVSTSSNEGVCYEDMDCWDCTSMGNKVCGGKPVNN